MQIKRKILLSGLIALAILANGFFPLTALGAGPNLIANPNFETASGVNPSGWSTGNWGTNTTTFSYPSTGATGNGARVSMTSYTDGDAKWYFADVPVTAGETYLFEDNFLSNTSTRLVARYTKSGGAVSYDDIGSTLSSGASWQKASAELVPPTGTVTLTVFHILAGVGSLTIDDASLTLQSTTTTPPVVPPTPTTTPPVTTGLSQGFVSFTFDDGLASQFNKAKPILDNAGIKGTFYIISHVIAGIVPLNPSFEIDADSNGTPDNWSKNKTGSSTTTFAYPTTGINGGSKAVKVDVSSYKNGEAGWAFDPVTILPDHGYVYKEQYKSTAKSSVMARIIKTDNSVEIVQIAAPASTNNAWRQLNASFYIPENAKSVSVYHVLKTNGSLTIDETSLGISSYMTKANVLSLASAGHEIGAHSQTHPDLTTLSTSDVQTELGGSQNELHAVVNTPVVSFAYPYGNTNIPIKQIAQSLSFTSARTVDEGLDDKTTNAFSLLGYSVEADTTLAEVKTQIDNAVANKQWLVLIFHQIDEQDAPYGTTSGILRNIVNYVKNKNVVTHTVAEGTALISQ